MNESYYKYWGKAKKNDDGTYDYHLLPYHCLDVAAVGSVLSKHDNAFLNSFIREIGISGFKAISIVELLLAIHDIGKFAKTFQTLVPEVQLQLQGINRGKPIPIRHDALGFALWRSKYLDTVAIKMFDLYGDEYINVLEIIEIFLNCTFGHHGIPSNPEDTIRLDDFFDFEDYTGLQAFFADIFKLFDIDYNCPIFTHQNKEALQKASWGFAGFITFADWIGSNSDFFKPMQVSISIVDYWKIALNSAEAAIEKLGLRKSEGRKNYSFQEFFPSIWKTPTPLQNYCNTCKIPDDPQLWLLEDVTGAGKTEAALILIARLIAKGLGNGLFVALPTMATSDAMYKRLAVQYRKLFEEKAMPSLVLAHGARHLSKDFRKSFLKESDEKSTAVEKNDNEAHCSSWFTDSNKKSLLADAGVGTIDQVLISVLPARHQSLRLYGLQGKVLLIDEVHAYDSYQHRLLCGVLEHHANNGGSAILLSATLPKEVRESLANAYLKGTGRNKIQLEKDNYPLSTCISYDGMVSEVEQDTRIDLKRTIHIRFENDYEKNLQLLFDNAHKGKCCCWIRNTVSDAMKTYEEIIKNYSVELVSLVHSRFTYSDRMQKESALVEHFGPKSNADSRKGRIVIATQVIEQSLDVDFDILISDLAPIDYLIQRMGRLFRHKRDAQGNRSDLEGRGNPELIVYGPETNNNPSSTWYSSVFPGASFVYKDHSVLWKTQQAIINAGQKITTPGELKSADGIRNLINQVYGADALKTPVQLQRQENEADGNEMSKDNLGRFNMLSLQEGYSIKSSGHWTEDVLVPTRIGEPQKEVYLAKVVNDELFPFEEGEYAWDLSTIKVRAGLIADTSFNDADSKLISDLKNKTKRFFDSDFIVPMEFKDGNWYCGVIKEKKSLYLIVYSRERGFQVETCSISP